MKMAWVQKGFLAARWDGRLQSFSSSDGWCEPKHVQTCWVSRLRSLEKDKTGGSNTGRLKTGGSKVVFAICLWVNIQGLWDPSWGWRGGEVPCLPGKPLVSAHVNHHPGSHLSLVHPTLQASQDDNLLLRRQVLLGHGGKMRRNSRRNVGGVSPWKCTNEMHKWNGNEGTCQHVRNWLNVSFVSRFPVVGVSLFRSVFGPKCSSRLYQELPSKFRVCVSAVCVQSGATTTYD